MKAYHSLKPVRGKISFQKCARKTLFPWEYYNDWDSNQVFRLVPTVLHLSAAKSKEFCFCIMKK
jgi:hypothetical protein